MNKLLTEILKFVIFWLIHLVGITTLQRTGEYNSISYLTALGCLLICLIVNSLLD